jgi:glycogen synthase
MRVFMLGWEFPPFISGGLGTACKGLTRGLDEIGVDVCFVLPTAVPIEGTTQTHVTLRSPTDLLNDIGDEASAGPGQYKHVEFRQVAAALQAYGDIDPAATIELEDDLRCLEAQDDAPARDLKILREHARAVKTKHLLREAIRAAALNEKPVSESGNSRVIGGGGIHYAGDMMSQVHRYAQLASSLAISEPFEVIHAHDWMTYPAGIAVAAVTGKPLVVHVHSTEFDRSGQNVNQAVYDIERAGMHAAARVVCVSHLTRNIVVNRYGVPSEKVHVIYNAVESDEASMPMSPIERDEKIVLFLGRITMQKGPEYFLRAARKVVDRYDKIRFVMAGSGDMIQQCIREAADLKLGRHVTFTGFLRGGDVARIFRMADLYVMPSVSEPFGIAPLEAMSHDVPVIISRQSGVSEVLTHVLKVDFWDIDEMANKILAVLRHEPLQNALREHGRFELQKLSWQDSARQLKDVYETLLG